MSEIETIRLPNDRIFKRVIRQWFPADSTGDCVVTVTMPGKEPVTLTLPVEIGENIEITASAYPPPEEDEN